MTWDEFAAGWDDQPGVREYAQAALDSLVDVADASDVRIAGSRACDFGCGTGLLTEHLVGMCDHVDAVDSSPAMLDVVRAKIERNGWDNVDVLEELPASGGRYDLIVCSSVCAFVDDYPATARRLVSSMTPGGLLVQWDWELDPDDDDPFGLTRVEIRSALDAAGLEAVRVDTAFEVLVDGDAMRPLMGSGRRPR